MEISQALASQVNHLLTLHNKTQRLKEWASRRAHISVHPFDVILDSKFLEFRKQLFAYSQPRIFVVTEKLVDEPIWLDIRIADNSTLIYGHKWIVSPDSLARRINIQIARSPCVDLARRVVLAELTPRAWKGRFSDNPLRSVVEQVINHA